MARQLEAQESMQEHELLYLIGKLSHARKVVQPSRVFLRGLIDLSTKAKHPDHRVKRDTEFWTDLAWWEVFLPSWKARSMMEIHRPPFQ